MPVIHQLCSKKSVNPSPFLILHRTLTIFMRIALPFIWFVYFSLLLGCTAKDESTEFPVLPEISVSEPIEEGTSPIDETVKHFTISIVGEVRGELEPCGCPTLPYGGFPRRLKALEEIRTEQTTVFHLDAGETLLKGFFSNKDITSKERALLIGELSNDVGVDAWTVGPSDLMAVGMDQLQTMDGPPRISATWKDSAGRLYFTPYTVLEKSDVRLAVIGLSTQPTDPRFQFVRTISAKEALTEVLPQIPKDVDMIVALGSMDDEEIDRLQQVFPKLQMFLTTEGATFEEPRHIPNSTQIVEAPKQGRFIHNVHIRSTTPLGLLDNRLPEADWRTWFMVQDDPTHPVQQKMQRLGTGRNLYYTELVPLSSTYDDASSSNTKIERFAQTTIQQSQQIADQPTTNADPGFAASGRCAQCHTAEMAKWSFSKHSRAWESLVTHSVEDSTENPDCISCHTTGFGQVGGFGEPSPSNIRKFKAVQCEACHGPLNGHPNESHVQPAPITEQTCTVCHDEANSPDFEFESYLRQATCQSK